MTRPALGYIPAIDGMRALAVLAVMIYHLRPAFLPGGFLGVDVFFVISGFVVSGALPPDGAGSLRQLIGLFYARRAARILPALYVVVLATTLAAALFIPESWLSGVSTHTAQGALRGYSNFVLANNEGDYFAPRTDYNPFTHTWSLGVEEQFYLLFPFLFQHFLIGRRALSASLFGVAGVISVLWAATHATSNPIGNFYLIFGRFWELSLGVLAYQAGAWPRLPRVAANLAAAALLISLAQGGTTPWPGSLLPCAATALLLVAMRSSPAGLLGRLLAAPSVLYLGRRSYSLYLWHWPIYVLFRWTIGLETAAAALLAPALTLVLAHASYTWIEAPPRRAIAITRIRPRTALAAAALLVIIGGPVQQALWRSRATIGLTAPARHPAAWYPDAHLDLPGSCRVAVGRVSVASGLGFNFGRTHCPPPPAVSAAATVPTLFVLGDSHAGAYTNLITRFVWHTGSPARLYIRGGCALLGTKPEDETSCAVFNQAALADITRSARSNDILFLPALRIPRIADQFVLYGVDTAIARNEGPDQQAWRTRNMVDAIIKLRPLTTLGLRIILETPKPEFPSPTFRCADWFNRTNPICGGGHTLPHATLDRLAAPVLQQFLALSTQLPGIRSWNPTRLLCPNKTCNAYAPDGSPLFFDGDHLSAAGNALLEPDFEAFVAISK